MVPPIMGEGRWRWLAATAFLGVAQAVAAGVAAFATRDVFAALHRGGGDDPDAAGAIAVLIAAGGVIAIARIAARAMGEHLGQRYATAMRHRLYAHLARLPGRLSAERRPGALSLRFVGDLAAARLWVGQGLARLITGAIVAPGAAIALWTLNPTLAMAAFAPLALCLIAATATAACVQPLHRRLRAKRAQIAIDMSERAAIAAELDLYGRTRRELRELDRNGRALARAATRRATATASVVGLIEIGGVAAAAAVLAAALASAAPPAEAAAAAALLGILATPLRDLAGVWDRRCAWRVAREKYQNVLRQPRLPARARKSTRRAPSDPPTIRFDNVAAGPIESFDATVAGGGSVLIVGPNGAGKTTLLRLAAGLDAPSAGVVRVAGGASGADLSRFRIAFVGDSAPVLQGSLRRALSLATPSRPDDAELTALMETYGLGDLCARLGGLSGRISEGGRNISRGELRRLQLARAELQDPEVLLIDDVESGIDDAGRALTHRLLQETRATILITANDLALVSATDAVWTLAPSCSDAPLAAADPSAPNICMLKNQA